MKKEKKYKGLNISKKDEGDYNYKIHDASPNLKKNDEKNFVSKLQMNLGLGLDKFKML